MSHPMVFMIGLHGSGKTTLGKLLETDLGWRHISVGDLGRSARSNRPVQGVAIRTLVRIGQTVPGTPLDETVAGLLINDLIKLNKSQPVVCDGFPSSVDHLALLPQGSTVVLVECKDGLRESRLEQRAALTRRAWTPGMASQRDVLVLGVFEQVAAHGHKAVVLDNSGDLLSALDFEQAIRLSDV